MTDLTSYPQAAMYASSAESEFVRVWSLGEHHETKLVMFESNSILHLSGDLLIGVAPNNLVKVWAKMDMKCLHILDLSTSNTGVCIYGTHLITNSGEHAISICDVSRKSLESHDVDLGLPEGCKVHAVCTCESSIVVDVQRESRFSFLLVSPCRH